MDPPGQSHQLCPLEVLSGVALQPVPETAGSWVPVSQSNHKVKYGWHKSPKQSQ